MNRRFTFQQYRAIDLTMFALMLAISESVIVTAAKWWFPDQLYTVSAVAAVTAIVLMRWGHWAAIHAAFGGFVFCLVSRGTAEQYLIYCAGNLLSLLALLFFRVFGKECVRTDGFLAVAFALCVQLLMQLGRAAAALMLGAEPARCVGLITTYVLSGLFTALIVWIARRLDGIFEDQKHYLLRINREEEKGGY